MATFTLRHTRADGLRESLDLLQRAYRRLTGTTAWRRLVKRYGYVGQARAIESPWGTANGWHPHTHALMFLRGMTDEQLTEFEGHAFDLWETAVVQEGGRPLLRGIGLKVTRGAAAYIAKVQERDGGWLAGSELARLDLKRGRRGSLMPFELLDLSGEVARSLWVEYVEATRGRRAIVWTKGLRDRLGLNAEQSDEDVMAQTEVSRLVFLLEGDEYDGIRQDPERLVAVLESAEQIVAKGGEC